MEKKYTKFKKDYRVQRITYLILCTLLVACSSGEVAGNDSVTTTSPEITFDYEKGLGGSPPNFVSNWNKLVNQVKLDKQ